MTSKKASVFGFAGALLATIAFGATVYASPLLEQGRDKRVVIVRHEVAPAIEHESHAFAPREKDAPAVRHVASKPRQLHCRWSTLEHGGGVVVVHGVSYDTSRVQICD